MKFELQNRELWSLLWHNHHACYINYFYEKVVSLIKNYYFILERDVRNNRKWNKSQIPNSERPGVGPFNFRFCWPDAAGSVPALPVLHFKYKPSTKSALKNSSNNCRGRLNRTFNRHSKSTRFQQTCKESNTKCVLTCSSSIMTICQHDNCHN